MEEVVRLFKEQEVQKAFKTKKVMLILYFVCFSVVFGAILTMLLVNNHMVNSNYDRSLQTFFTFLSAVFGSGYAVFSLFFFSLKYRLTRKYVKMLKGFKIGILDTSDVTFLSYEMSDVFKDGVYFYTMIVNSKPLRRDDITERRILIEHTIPPPEFLENDRIRVTTHGNILVQYQKI